MTMLRSVPAALFVVAALSACGTSTETTDAGAAAVVPIAPSSAAPQLTASGAPPGPAAQDSTARAKGGTSVSDAGAKTADAGATTLADAGAAQECCCEAPSFALQSVAMSECSKVRKGACVPKSRCAAAPVADAGAARPAQTCCCQTGDSKAVATMSACYAGGKGRCVVATECKP